MKKKIIVIIFFLLCLFNTSICKANNRYEEEQTIDKQQEQFGISSYLNEAQKYNDKLDFTELKKCVFNHNCDIELRNKILQLVALKLLYSKNTIPERGYERAKRFINEFNKKLGLSLSCNQIDEIIQKDYSNGEKWETIVKTYIDEKGDKHSYLTVENVAKQVKKLKR